MLHALFDGIDITFGWPTLVAGAYGQSWMSVCVRGTSRDVDKPAKVQTVTCVSIGEHPELQAHDDLPVSMEEQFVHRVSESRSHLLLVFRHWSQAGTG